MYEAGKTEEIPTAKGLTLLSKNFTDYVGKFEKYSDRFISGKIKKKRSLCPDKRL